jgi:hypothetical protein
MKNVGADGCKGGCFFSNFDFFFQQKLVIIVCELQLHDWDERSIEGWG